MSDLYQTGVERLPEIIARQEPTEPLVRKPGPGDDMPEGNVTVTAPSNMEKADFAKHMTFRHKDSLGGMAYLSETISDYDEGLYRSFHKRLHETRVDLKHEHARGEAEQAWQDGV